MFNWLDHKLGIDLGTSNTLIYQKGKGIVLQEPSVLAIRKDTGAVEAVGKEAKAMIGRTPENLEIVQPIEDGVIANFDMTTVMLQHLLGKISNGYRWLKRSHVAISVPSDITDVKRRAVQDAVQQAGASKTLIIEEPLAAAMGAELPVNQPCGHLVVNIGGSTIQAAIISLGGIVISHSIRKGGMTVDRAIMEMIKKKHNLAVGLPTAEELKKDLGLAVMTEKEEQVEVKGRNLVNGLPRSIAFTSLDLHPLFNDFIFSITEAIRLTIEKCPPELAGDVIERGIVLCGGGALIGGLEQRLQKDLSIPVRIAEQAERCVVLGTGKILDAEPAKKLFGHSHKIFKGKEGGESIANMGENVG